MARKRKKQAGPPVGTIIGIGVGVLVALGVIGGATWFAVKGLPGRGGVMPLPPVPGVENALNAVAAAAPPPKLPPGWSYNDPALGFRAAWPTPPAADGYTDRERTFGNASVKSNGWGYRDEASKIDYHISYTDFDAITAEHGVFLDGALKRMYDLAAGRAAARGKPVPPYTPPAAISWLGRPARKFVDLRGEDGQNGESRHVIFGTKMYQVDVTFPTTIATDDPRITTFFDTFWGE